MNISATVIWNTWFSICILCICVADHGYYKIFWREIVQENISQQWTVSNWWWTKETKRGSRNESSSSTLNDVFAETLKNPDFVLILANYLRSLEQQVHETFDLAKKSSESQIKGELALQEVNKAISFIGEKINVFEQERRENQKQNEELNGTVSKMNERTEELENKFDCQE